jgi:hypothetical protein
MVYVTIFYTGSFIADVSGLQCQNCHEDFQNGTVCFLREIEDDGSVLPVSRGEIEIAMEMLTVINHVHATALLFGRLRCGRCTGMRAGWKRFLVLNTMTPPRATWHWMVELHHHWSLGADENAAGA